MIVGRLTQFRGHFTFQPTCYASFPIGARKLVARWKTKDHAADSCLLCAAHSSPRIPNLLETKCPINYSFIDREISGRGNGTDLAYKNTRVRLNQHESAFSIFERSI
jgi:hypothetical protein